MHTHTLAVARSANRDNRVVPHGPMKKSRPGTNRPTGRWDPRLRRRFQGFLRNGCRHLRPHRRPFSCAREREALRTQGGGQFPSLQAARLAVSRAPLAAHYSTPATPLPRPDGEPRTARWLPTHRQYASHLTLIPPCYF
jgi:hypothetical protein